MGQKKLVWCTHWPQPWSSLPFWRATESDQSVGPIILSGTTSWSNSSSVRTAKLRADSSKRLWFSIKSESWCHKRNWWIPFPSNWFPLCALSWPLSQPIFRNRQQAYPQSVKLVQFQSILCQFSPNYAGKALEVAWTLNMLIEYLLGSNMWPAWVTHATI